MAGTAHSRDQRPEHAGTNSDFFGKTQTRASKHRADWLPTTAARLVFNPRLVVKNRPIFIEVVRWTKHSSFDGYALLFSFRSSCLTRESPEASSGRAHEFAGQLSQKPLAVPAFTVQN